MNSEPIDTGVQAFAVVAVHLQGNGIVLHPAVAFIHHRRRRRGGRAWADGWAAEQRSKVILCESNGWLWTGRSRN